MGPRRNARKKQPYRANRSKGRGSSHATEKKREAIRVEEEEEEEEEEDDDDDDGADAPLDLFATGEEEIGDEEGEERGEDEAAEDISVGVFPAFLKK